MLRVRCESRAAVGGRRCQTTGDGYESACTIRRSSNDRNQYAAFGVLTSPIGTSERPANDFTTPGMTPPWLHTSTVPPSCCSAAELDKSTPGAGRVVAVGVLGQHRLEEHLLAERLGQWRDGGPASFERCAVHGVRGEGGEFPEQRLSLLAALGVQRAQRVVAVVLLAVTGSGMP